MRKIFLLACISLIACTIPIDPVNVEDLSVELEVIHIIHDPDFEQITIVGGSGRVVVQAPFCSPTGGYELRPELSRDPELGVVLTVRGVQVAPGLTVADCRLFNANVFGFQPGRYRVTLQYMFDAREEVRMIAREVIVVR